MFGEGRNRVFNFVTVFFLVLTIACLVLTAVFAAGIVPVPFLAPRPPVIPQVAVVPSPTITNTPIPPTWTFTPSKTPTPSSTPTATSSPTPSLTITSTPGPTDTPTITPTASETYTPTPTETFTPSVTPTGPTPTFTPTPSPFPFVLQGNSVVFTANFANTAGCAWQGIGGQVFGLSGEGLTGYQVRITGGGLGEGGAGVVVMTGSNTLYGPSGWEQFVAGQTNNETYFVELLSPQGTPISPTVQVTFPNNCAQNLALVNFVQTRPY